jgi:hypothetical protein
MEPLFSAVVCGCNAGLFREVLHEVYMPRIQRGNAHFAANVLGATGPLLSALVHFFEHGRWGSPVGTAVEEQRLTAEDQLFILMQAAAYLTTREMGSPEARICYERAESLCQSLGSPLLLYVAPGRRWGYRNPDVLRWRGSRGQPKKRRLLCGAPKGFARQRFVAIDGRCRS